MSRLFSYALLLYFVNLTCNSQVPQPQTEKDRLTLISKINLPNVSGRIDHIAYDPVNHLVFIAALGNNSVEIADINAKHVAHTITGLHEPQGIAYIPSLKKLVVANGDNGDCIFFDAATYKESGVVHLKSDADNIRYDEAAYQLFVGYGNGAIAVIDANSMKQVGNIPLDGHPESFQISNKQHRIYINVPDANEIEVADLLTNKVIAKWKNMNASSNFPMALDENNDRLFIGCRNPAKLRMISTETGKDISAVESSGDADDVFYNPTDSVVYVSAGKGFIDVFRIGPGELNQIDHIKSRSGARTSLLLVNEKRFLLAVPARGGNGAALWIYHLD